VGGSASNVVADRLRLSTSLVGVGLVDVVLASLLDVGANRGGGISELVDGILGVAWEPVSWAWSIKGGAIQWHLPGC
jgi:hypothetical protein